ncbi:MAG TPA: glycoside hydrolase family 88 protein [Pyrinomonadaceae bacterium]|jgi:rhamnogalacturonyl hydrolase YesR|nr:glycoside hydrolase family 88 protein [Pyrinomonadaceae bacterium]
MKKQIVFLLLVSLIFALNAGAQTAGIFQKKTIKAKMLKVADWQLKNPKHELYDWTNGAFYAGVFAAYETTKSPEIMKALMEMGERNNWQTGKRFDHADDIVISQTYIDIYRLKKDRKMIQPTIDAIRKIQTEKSTEVEKHGIIWWWCDALFMAPPTLAKLGKTLNDKTYYELNDKFFMETYNLLYDKQEKLFARDAGYLINEKGEGRKEANGKKIFWSRGNGWVAGGLVRLLKELPKDYPNRAFYENLYKEMMERVLLLQQTDGLWRSSLLDPEAYPGGEASGSGFYLYAMAWGVSNKMLDKNKFLPAIKKGWTGLNALVKEDGKVGWTQPIGADPRKNFDAESWEVYGAGAYLLAGSEIIKLKF